ncbi:MAG: tetratricopeptide repeat protein, partial [Ardenticatenaceae bacterium]
VTFLKEALAIANQVPAAQQARWQRLLGEAYFGLGQLAQSRPHFQQALALLGFKMPTTTFSLISGLTKQLGHHLWLWLRSPVPASDAERENLLEAFNSYWGLGLILYQTNEVLPLFVVILRGVNFALLAGPSPELAQAYLGMMTIYRQAGLHTWAELSYQRAYKMALKYPSSLAWVLGAGEMLKIGYQPWSEIQKGFEEGIV